MERRYISVFLCIKSTNQDRLNSIKMKKRRSAKMIIFPIVGSFKDASLLFSTLGRLSRNEGACARFPLRITRRISEVRKFAFGIAKDQRELYCGDPTSAYPANGCEISAGARWFERSNLAQAWRKRVVVVCAVEGCQTAKLRLETILVDHPSFKP